MSAVRTPAKHPRPTVVGRAPDELAGRDQPAGEAAPVAVRGTPDGAIESRLAVMPTVDLVARVRTGDRDALEVICLRCLRGLHGFAAGRVPPRIRGMVDTQDLVAEALEKGLAKLLDLDLGRAGALMAYFRQILRNLIVDKIRGADRAPRPEPLNDQHADDTLSPLERALDREKVEIYEAALQRLKPRDAEMIILRVDHQASYDEVAVFLGQSTANAARIAVRRALLKLANEMSRASRVRGERRGGDES
jgi:RNA polymerase sigma factor (sigma-70 family)